MEILWKRTVSAEFEAVRLNLCGNCIFRKFPHQEISEITVFMQGFAKDDKNIYSCLTYMIEVFCHEDDEISLVFWNDFHHLR